MGEYTWMKNSILWNSNGRLDFQVNKGVERVKREEEEKKKYKNPPFHNKKINNQVGLWMKEKKLNKKKNIPSTQ